MLNNLQKFAGLVAQGVSEYQPRFFCVFFIFLLWGALGRSAMLWGALGRSGALWGALRRSGAL